MKINCLSLNVALGLGCAAMAMGGNVSEDAAPIVDDAGHNPWNLELTHMQLIADGAAGYANYFDQTHESAYRLSLSYQPSADGLGYRAIWTEFEGNRVPFSGEHGPSIENLELEVFKDSSYGALQVEYSFGLRYTDVFEPFASFVDVNWEGYGPNAGIAIEYPLGKGFSIYADASLSYMFGDSKVIGNRVGDDKLFQQYGFGLKYQLSSLGVPDLYIKTGYELQKYEEIAWLGSDADVSGWLITLGYNF